MIAALLIDFGSTYTKLRAVNLDRPRVLAAGQGPSTVATDVRIGMDAALADLEKNMGGLPSFKYRLASSSAAGGLKMVTIGLVKELTAEAARQAALGAGAKLCGTFTYRLTPSDEARIAALAPDIILLAGGTDGGNVEVVRHNADRLARSGIACTIVVAGNRDVSEELAAQLAAAGKNVRITENVMPSFGVLNIDPARDVIRRIFIDRIVHAKGIDRAAASFDAVLMPTPAAVLEGATLLARGVPGGKGLGDLMVVDIGGATTDVHSVAAGAPSREGVVQIGLPEPFVKRTVEGDLGMRHNAATIVQTAGMDLIAARSGLDGAEIGRQLDAIARNIERLPADSTERAFDEALAWAAVRVAVARHAGTSKIVQTVQGPVTVQAGKDLSRVGTIIGTGGPLAHGATPATALEAALADPAEPFSLRPDGAALLIDTEYVLYAAGLLAAVEPGAAMALALGSLKPAVKGKPHEHRHQIA